MFRAAAKYSYESWHRSGANQDVQCEFEQVSPAAKVASRNVVSSDLGGGISAFQTDFSIMSALEEISYLHGLAATGQLNDHHMSEKVLKTAAALQVVTGYRGLIYRVVGKWQRAAKPIELISKNFKCSSICSRDD